MITTLDTQSWAKELQTGNAQFLRAPDGTLWIVSNVRADGTFAVLRSDPVPPQPGPGAKFTEVATYTFPDPNIDFDPVVAYDDTGATPLLHIIGTRANHNHLDLVDLIKFTLDINTLTLSAPVDLILGSSIQSAYDIVTLSNGVVTSGGTSHKMIACAVNNPVSVAEGQQLFQTTVTNIAIAQSGITVDTGTNAFQVGQLIALSGLGISTFLNGAELQITTVSPTQFTAVYYYQTIRDPQVVPNSGPYTIQATPDFESDIGVQYGDTYLPLQKVVSSPAVGQYTVSGTGLYTFNAADASRQVLLSYNKFYSQADTGFAQPKFSGQTLLAFELDDTDAVVANSLHVIANSPDRSGNVVSSVSMLTPNGVNVEFYYESHPKTITYKDQIFKIYEMGLNQTAVTDELHNVPSGSPYTITVSSWQSDVGVKYGDDTPLVAVVGSPAAGEYSVAAGVYTFNSADAGVLVKISYLQNTYSWDNAPTELTSFTGRYTDERLTAYLDGSNNRYLSQIYYTQINHPEGLYGNAILAKKALSDTSWTFHETYGSVLGGSFIQGTLTMAEDGTLSFVYLLQPFDYEPVPPNVPASYPLHVADVDPATMSFTDVQGFYNQQQFTWLRGTKSLIDTPSLWAAVGEKENLTTLAEVHVIPAEAPHALAVANAANFWQNISVVDNSGTSPVAYTEALNNPQQYQYDVQPNGLYTFNQADASVGIIGLDLTSDQLTITGSNIQNLRTGMQVLFEGLTSSTYLNGQTVTVTAVDLEHSTFSAVFTHADDPEHSETGYAGKPITISYTYVSSIVPIYVSFFNVPPVVQPLTLPATVYRAQSIGIQAIYNDADVDPVVFAWTLGAPIGTNPNRLSLVSLTATGANAVLVVPRSIGGDSLSFNVGVSVIDLLPDHVTPRHPAVAISDITVNGVGDVTITANTNMAVDETFMLYSVALSAPSAPTVNAVAGISAAITNIVLTGNVLTVTANNNFSAGQLVSFGGLTHFNYLNGVSVTVISATATQFTAAFTHADDSFADTGNALYPVATTYYGKLTYVNPFGESTASAEFTAAMLDGQLPQIVSPAASGDATSYNVYLSDATGTEVLQNAVPISLGTDFTLPTSGLQIGTASIPTVNTAYVVTVNDRVYTVTSWSPTQVIGSSSPFVPAYPLTNVTGYLIPQYQFATGTINVPFNAAPTLTFPSPQWNAGPSISVARNTSLQIGVNSPSYPVQIDHMDDADDAPTYLWEQLTGTTVSLSGESTPDIVVQTNGVDIHGETLTFRLTVNDGVNAPVSQTFSVVVAAYNFAGLDQKRLSRSLWTEQDEITKVAVTSNVLTITADNTFVAGQQVTFSGVVTATWLNGKTVTVVTATSTSFTAAFTHADYAETTDTGFATAFARLSQRNTPQTWSALDQSGMYSDLATVKRTSVLDGTDRYVVISANSVMVYGGIHPDVVLLRKLFTPNSTKIVDAVHTENDYTLVLDDNNGFFRYSEAPLINTDNPDFILDLSTLSGMSFNKIMVTYSHGNVRVIAFSGPEGCMLMQVANDTLEIQGLLQLSIESGLVAGSNNVQFVRLNNVEDLRSGKVLVGTITNYQADITNVTLQGNKLTVVCLNNFFNGDTITFSGLTDPALTFLNGVRVKILSNNGNTFTASYEHADVPSTATTAGIAIALTAGKTYESLIDLAHGQIIGTWDASKLKNQFVNTGEILFEPDSTYSGRPVPPVQGIPTQGSTPQGATVTVVWTQQRPDLVSGYNIEYATQPTVTVLMDTSLSYVSPAGFGEDIGVVDVSATANITNVSLTSNVVTLTANNNFAVGAVVKITNLSGAAFLNNQNLTITTASSTQFTAAFTHADYVSTPDSGVATQTINLAMTAVPSAPGPGQYTVAANGVYNFNIAQLNHNIQITFRSNFVSFAQITSGAVTKYTAVIPSGTYAFRIQALSKDGASDYSNVQVITI